MLLFLMRGVMIAALSTLVACASGLPSSKPLTPTPDRRQAWHTRADSVSLLRGFISWRSRFAPGPVNITLCGSTLSALMTDSSRALLQQYSLADTATRIQVRPDCRDFDTRPPLPFPNLLRIDSIVTRPESAYVRGKFLAAERSGATISGYQWIDITMVSQNRLSYHYNYFVISGLDRYAIPQR